MPDAFSKVCLELEHLSLLCYLWHLCSALSLSGCSLSSLVVQSISSFVFDQTQGGLEADVLGGFCSSQLLSHTLPLKFQAFSPVLNSDFCFFCPVNCCCLLGLYVLVPWFGKCSQVQIWDRSGAHLLLSLSQNSQPLLSPLQCLKIVASYILSSCMIAYSRRVKSDNHYSLCLEVLPKEFSGAYQANFKIHMDELYVQEQPRKNDKEKNEKKLVQLLLEHSIKLQKLKYGDNGILLGK